MTTESRQLIIGAMFRALGAYPSGWRVTGAHHTPVDDVKAIREAARLAEDAKLDYLFFGDWLATGHDLEYRDPYLLARIDPVSAITFAAGITEHIGLIATANTTYSDPYTLARSTASIDLLSGGRAGLNLVTGAESRAAGNHGRDAHDGNEVRYDRAEEFITALRSLWDSFEDDAFVGDQANGVLIDPTKLHRTDLVGRTLRVSGPLNTARPVQGHLPIVNAGTSQRSRALVAHAADLALVALPSIEAGIDIRARLRAAAAAAGRNPDDLKIIAPVLPVVAETTDEAWAIVDLLISLVPVDEGGSEHTDAAAGSSAAAPAATVLPEAFPTNRTIAALGETVGADLTGRSLDELVTETDAAVFSPAGQRLITLVHERTGRTISDAAHANDVHNTADATAHDATYHTAHRGVTFRHLLVTSVIPAAIVAGDATKVADHFEAWFTSGAVDGFNVLTAFQPAQFESFTRLVIPELQRRGLFRTAYTGSTLREHLGLERPQNVHRQLALVDA